jgi:hypothetical protein
MEINPIYLTSSGIRTYPHLCLCGSTILMCCDTWLELVRFVVVIPMFVVLLMFVKNL